MRILLALCFFLTPVPYAGALTIEAASAARQVTPVNQPVAVARPATLATAVRGVAPTTSPHPRTIGDAILISALAMIAALGIWKALEKSRRALTRQRHRRRGYYKVRY